MKKHSKRYQEAEKLIDKKKIYTLKEAINILKKAPVVKFDESLDFALKLNVDAKKSDQMVRGTVKLPYGRGKKVRVVVFCKDEKANEAKDAGADFIGGDELIEKVARGWLDFDSCIATPEMMRTLGKLGKILGPRGLMPSAKSGTVTVDIGQAVREIKKGRVEFKMDKLGGLQLSIGKVSFEENKLYENSLSALEAIQLAKPQTVKGKFIKSISISTSMGPGIKVEVP